jgi:hypothetical protein
MWGYVLFLSVHVMNGVMVCANLYSELGFFSVMAGK